MTAMIHTLIVKEAKEVVDTAASFDCTVFDARRTHATLGKSNRPMSARWLAKLIEDYEEAPYVLSELRPQMVKSIILARPNPLLLLASNAVDVEQMTIFLRGLGFMVAPFSKRKKAALPLFASVQEF